jgi:hypothetical protein
MVSKSRVEDRMRHLVLASIVLALAPVLHGQSPSKLDDSIQAELLITDPSVLRPCQVGALVAQIGRQARVPVGLEQPPDCPPGPWMPPGDHTRSLGTISAHEAFDRVVMMMMPMYSWKDMDGVVVFRPAVAWDDPRNVLNLQTKDFKATNRNIDDLLHLLLRSVQPAVFYPHMDVPRSGRLVDRLASVEFPGGTMLEAVNALVRAGGELEWQLGYPRRHPIITLATLDLPGDVVMTPVLVPPVR